MFPENLQPYLQLTAKICGKTLQPAECNYRQLGVIRLQTLLPLKLF